MLCFCFVSIAVLCIASARNYGSQHRVYDEQAMPYEMQKYIVMYRVNNTQLICHGCFFDKFIAKVKGSKIGICTGSIVDPRWILTAAHCVDAIQEDLHMKHRTNGTVRSIAKVKMDDIYLHPKHKQANPAAEFDLALLKTTRPVHVKFPGLIEPIALAEVAPKVKYEDLCCPFFAGYGDYEQMYRTEARLSKPRKATGLLTTCPKDVAGSMLCVTSAAGAADGDSGGPLVFKHKLLGVTFSSTCHGEKTFMSGCITKFISVPANLQWIQSTIKKNT